MKIPQMTMAPKRNKESSVYLKDLHSLAPTEGSSYTGLLYWSQWSVFKVPVQKERKNAEAALPAYVLMEV
jgi:hypothetical protein